MITYIKKFNYRLIFCLIVTVLILQAPLKAYNTHLSPPTFLENSNTVFYDIKSLAIQVDSDNKSGYISGNNLIKILKQLGFKYALQFNPEFKLEVSNNGGKLANIMVTKDREYAFILRRNSMFYSSKNENETSLNVFELNPFVDSPSQTNPNKKGKEIYDGYVRFKLDYKNQIARLGPGPIYAIELKTFKDKGIGTILLSLAIEESFRKGIKKFIIHDPEKRAIPFYKRLGFSGNHSLSLSLSEFSTLTKISKAPWKIINVLRSKNINNGDFRFKDNFPLLKKNTYALSLLKSRVFTNILIKRFNEFDESVPQLRDAPLTTLAFNFLKINTPEIDNVILYIEEKGTRYIKQRGQEILNEFGKKHYKNGNFAKTWEELIRKNTIGKYDFTQLLASTLTVASSYYKLIRDYNNETVLDHFKDALSELWVILRALDIEAAQTKNLYRNDIPYKNKTTNAA